MHIDFNDILGQISPVVQATTTTLIAALAAKGLKTLHRVDQKAVSEMVVRLARTFVLSVEQKWGKEMENEKKRQEVLGMLKKRLPFVPTWILEAAIEAAVAELKVAQKTVIPMVPVGPRLP